MNTTLKPKFKLGQTVWYIANGYVEKSSIKAILVSVHEELVYSTEVPKYVYDGEGRGADSHYKISYENILCEENLFTSRDALAKSIKDEEDDE